MALEIERKFLVEKSLWNPNVEGLFIAQGYLNRDPERTVRVRIYGEKGFLTIKGKSEGASRAEFEYEIPIDEAKALLELCYKPIIEKVRYRVEYEGMIWEVDDFKGENAGLLMAEIELNSEEQPFKLPSWAKEEVTSDNRYFNSFLSMHPFRSW
jgi:adenylate cyclase